MDSDDFCSYFISFCLLKYLGIFFLPCCCCHSRGTCRAVLEIRSGSNTSKILLEKKNWTSSHICFSVSNTGTIEGPEYIRASPSAEELSGHSKVHLRQCCCRDHDSLGAQPLLQPLSCCFSPRLATGAGKSLLTLRHFSTWRYLSLKTMLSVFPDP